MTFPSHPAPFDPWSSIFGALSTQPAKEKPTKVTRNLLMDAIASTLAGVKAYELAAECVRFSLPPEGPGEDAPEKGKFRYVRRRLTELSWEDLVALGWKVNNDYETSELTHLLDLAGARGVEGELKNLVFATTGPKPKLVLADAINNTIKIVENADYCLVYDRPLRPDGLTWRELVAWWAQINRENEKEEREVAHDLYRRLMASMDDNGAERFLFVQYCKLYGSHGYDIPALIPQVYLHYDPYTKRKGATLHRQRMDFLLLLPNKRRVVLELDGVQHYAEDDGKASPSRYAQMVAEDRKLRLAGYEVYRFGGKEIAARSKAGSMLEDFFLAVLKLKDPIVRTA